MAARILPILCLLAAVWTTACNSSEPAPQPQPQPRVFGRWDMVELHGQPRAFQGEVPYLQISPDGKLAGFAGVNRFTGQADPAGLREGRFEPGPMAVTKMAGSAEAMAFERRFLGALEGSTRCEVREGQLELIAGDTCLARFAPHHQ
ncbi:MAG TPA: META domain-containing protein [Planctomycetota bacterium]|nr:META domain-containing protein [Planctomycetota bacterium]